MSYREELWKIRNGFIDKTTGPTEPKPIPKKSAKKIEQEKGKPSRSTAKPVSKKQAKALREYSKISKAFLAEHEMCEIQSPECTGKATEIHHTKGRIGALLIDTKYFMASCSCCNQYVEKHDAWARENGFKKSKH